MFFVDSTARITDSIFLANVLDFPMDPFLLSTFNIYSKVSVGNDKWLFDSLGPSSLKPEQKFNF